MSGNIFRETIEQPSDRVIVALDNMDWPTADSVMQEVGEYVGMGKANALAQRFGWEHAVQQIGQFGAATMADPKYEDIPSTMQNHLREITVCGPRLITVHASNNIAALQAAVRGRDEAKEKLMQTCAEGGFSIGIDKIGGILGVTVLTSISNERGPNEEPSECERIYGAQAEEKVVQFAHTALEAGLDGIVCSSVELKAIRKIPALDRLVTVVPGITPLWAAKPADQQRVSTPTKAIQDGADFLVIGRAICEPPEGISRTEAAQRIAQELAEA